jgi:hypothetical protein
MNLKVNPLSNQKQKLRNKKNQINKQKIKNMIMIIK